MAFRGIRARLIVGHLAELLVACGAEKANRRVLARSVLRPTFGESLVMLGGCGMLALLAISTSQFDNTVLLFCMNSTYILNSIYYIRLFVLSSYSKKMKNFVLCAPSCLHLNNALAVAEGPVTSHSVVVRRHIPSPAF